uniref:Receptor ligand binding region domain-containing protein n=1 Tax=Anopheles culicifacies TaxID=139723 RepID=A0A182MJ61_9DIPT
MELPPFNYRNALIFFGGVKQIRAEAAYLYDAVHLYANALMQVLLSGGSPKNGSAIIEAIKGRAYMSAMGYLVHIDENGDATGNYTILARKPVPSTTVTNQYGLFPIGRFSSPTVDRIPVSGCSGFTHTFRTDALLMDSRRVGLKRKRKTQTHWQ